MNTYELRQVLEVNNALGEGPVWYEDEQALYWVDLIPGHLFRYYPATGHYEKLETGLSVGCLAGRARSGLVLATNKGLAFCNWQEGTLDFFADPENAAKKTRFNDGKADRQGRFWAGTTGSSELPEGSLYRLDPDRTIQKMETEVMVSNGIGWSPDNQIMYYTDSPRHIIYAYDFDPDTGEISNRCPFVHNPEEEGVPDGLTVDSEGFVWSARWKGWKITRYDPKGRVEREIKLPVQYPTSCAFGGSNLSDLYITSCSITLNESEKALQPMAGNLLVLPTDFRGIPEPKFLG